MHQEVLCSAAFVTDMDDLRTLEFHHSAFGQLNDVCDDHFTDHPLRIGMHTQKSAGASPP
ncbi:hypothetical protein ALO98_04280 [Pseudomonas syringae pv. tagetis]|nr:hypothetical protein ALO98_04280 [Pseudomonas syringae pv. tagetis]